jgi:hypothetical protein
MTAALISLAQTNFSIVTVTNVQRSAQNFRVVNGQLYNSAYSQLWKMQRGKILEVQPDGVVLQTFTTNNVYEFVKVRGVGTPGAFGGTSDHNERKLVSSELLPSQRLFIRHYLIGAVDQTISVPAMKTGSVEVSGTRLEEWDCGLPNLVTNIFSQKIIKK